MMPTAKRALVKLSRRHTWKRMCAWNLKRQCSVAPERYVPGGGEQLPGWAAVCTATPTQQRTMVNPLDLIHSPSTDK